MKTISFSVGEADQTLSFTLAQDLYDALVLWDLPLSKDLLNLKKSLSDWLSVNRHSLND